MKNTSELARHHIIAVPKALSKELSANSSVEDCFLRQRFSRDLQEFLVSYSLAVTSPFTLTDESYSALEESIAK